MIHESERGISMYCISGMRDRDFIHFFPRSSDSHWPLPSRALSLTDCPSPVIFFDHLQALLPIVRTRAANHRILCLSSLSRGESARNGHIVYRLCL